MLTVAEKLKYIRESIENVKSFYRVRIDPASRYRIKAEGGGPFEYPPAVVFEFSEEFVEDSDFLKLREFLEEAIDIGKERLSNPPLPKYHFQGWVKVTKNGACFTPRNETERRQKGTC